MFEGIATGAACVLIVLGLVCGRYVVFMIRDEWRRSRQRKSGLKFHPRMLS
ncbi:MAG: hypothetical protein JEY79_11005 [Pseudodesulfovibrio sp.]|nr:hypothetical protein [Pseudodesulfovibrio sp.]